MIDDHRMLIDGAWVASGSGATFDAISPSSGEVIATVPEGTRDDARRAIAAAGRASEGWARRSAFDRAAAMRRVAVRTGWVNVNEGTNYWESHLPFEGRAGSASGVGRVGGRFSMERLTELKTVVVNVS
jgi:acyl-CoA reductase-like NAD-dependent aldehyde dehydrogenase